MTTVGSIERELEKLMLEGLATFRHWFGCNDSADHQVGIKLEFKRV